VEAHGWNVTSGDPVGACRAESFGLVGIAGFSGLVPVVEILGKIGLTGLVGLVDDIELAGNREDPMTGYQLNVFIHVLAAVVWLGGMFFLGAVGAPVLRKVEPADLRASLFRQIGSQFRGLGWAAITVLVVTGVINLQYRGLLTWQVWGGFDFWTTGYGRVLATKLFLVVAMIGVQAIHDFAVGPAASRAAPGSPSALRLRKWAAWLARVNTILGVVLIYVAVRLARGG